MKEVCFKAGFFFVMIKEWNYPEISVIFPLMATLNL